MFPFSLLLFLQLSGKRKTLRQTLPSSLSSLHFTSTQISHKYWHQNSIRCLFFPPFQLVVKWNSRFCLKKQSVNVFMQKSHRISFSQKKSWVVICDDFSRFVASSIAVRSHQILKSDKIPADNFRVEVKRWEIIQRQWRRVQRRRRARIEW